MGRGYDDQSVCVNAPLPTMRTECSNDGCRGYIEDNAVNGVRVLVCPLAPQNTLTMMNPEYLHRLGGGVGCPLIKGDEDDE